MSETALMIPNLRTRMAPSPTGKLHLGTAYATMWPYLLARHNNGEFILRIEDTDADRSTQEFADDIIDGLKWLGFEWNEGPFYQMDRLNLYKEKVDQLQKKDLVYPCFCTKEELEEERKKQASEKLPQVYSGKCRNLPVEEVSKRKAEGREYVIRFKMPEDRGKISFNDLVHGEITFDSKLIGDFVIARASGIPLYNFVVVVDDIDMRITHVLRGDDHISNTPKQVVLFEAFETKPPVYGHYPVILNQDRVGKLSKRTGSTPVEFYRQEGYLPEALFNYLALLGWSSGDDREIFSKDELIEKFRVEDMNGAAAAWNSQKLDWLNGEYIRAMSDEELEKRLQKFLVDHPGKDRIMPLVPLVKERMKKLSDFVALTDFLFEGTEYDKKEFKEVNIAEKEAVLEKVIEKLDVMPRPWTQEVFEKTMRDLADEMNVNAREVFQLIRVAFSGQLVTPPLLEIMQFVGEDEAIKRIKQGLEFLRS